MLQNQNLEGKGREGRAKEGKLPSKLGGTEWRENYSFLCLGLPPLPSPSPWIPSKILTSGASKHGLDNSVTLPLLSCFWGIFWRKWGQRCIENTSIVLYVLSPIFLVGMHNINLSFRDLEMCYFFLFLQLIMERSCLFLSKTIADSS